MSPQRTNTRRSPTTVLSPYAYPFLPTKAEPQRGVIKLHPARLGAQPADARAEKILLKIHTEYMKPFDIHRETLARLQREQFEKAELERKMDYQSGCLQAAENRAWHFEERAHKLEVQLASGEADQQGQD